MKILLDENLPRRLKASFVGGLQVHTVQERGWLGKRNGELLGLMTLEGFDAFVTIDKNLRYQQNLDRFSIQVFVLNAPNNKIQTLEGYITELFRLIEVGVSDQVVIVDI